MGILKINNGGRQAYKVGKKMKSRERNTVGRHHRTLSSESVAEIRKRMRVINLHTHRFNKRRKRMAYIYLIKYNNTVIAAAEDDKKAKEVIKQYRKNENSMDKKLFEIEAIRYFGGNKE